MRRFSEALDNNFEYVNRIAERIIYGVCAICSVILVGVIYLMATGQAPR